MARVDLSTRLIFLGVFATILLSSAAWGAPAEIVLYNFCQLSNCADGGGPNGGLVFDADGNLYGTTTYGGTTAFRNGTVFELSPAPTGWTETVLYSFCVSYGCPDGQQPSGALIFDSNGNLYGTTVYGGAYGYGTVFELSPSQSGWTETVLYSFCPGGYDCNGLRDLYPGAGVTMDKSGNLWGTTGWGGVFELSPSQGRWTENIAYFVGDSDPAGVALDSAGNVYGVAEQGGINSYPGGYVFELSKSSGIESVLYGFEKNAAGKFAQGYNPNSTPVFDAKGNLYGTTQYNGVSSSMIGGTVYKLTPGKKKWAFRLLHTFNGKNGDGIEPYGTMAVDASGNVFGATSLGGASECQGTKNYCGTVFEISLSGSTYTETVLWSFNETDGEHPMGGVILDKSGNVYGTTFAGGTGTWSNGVVFEVIP